MTYTAIRGHLAEGGLCNRLRGLISLRAMTRHAGLKLAWTWLPTSHCPVELMEILEDLPDLLGRSEKVLELKSFIPKAFNVCSVPHTYFNQFKATLLHGIDQQSFDKMVAAEARALRVERTLLEDLEAKKAETHASELVGVHIRRTDFVTSIRKNASLIPVFNKMNSIVRADPNTRFLVVSDHRESIGECAKRYGVVCTGTDYDPSHFRQSSIRDAMKDLYLLAATKRLIGTIRSSYSWYASVLGGMPSEFV
jgi:hypothetical protein